MEEILGSLLALPQVVRQEPAQKILERDVSVYEKDKQKQGS